LRDVFLPDVERRRRRWRPCGLGVYSDDILLSDWVVGPRPGCRGRFRSPAKPPVMLRSGGWDAVWKWSHASTHSFLPCVYWRRIFP